MATEDSSKIKPLALGWGVVRKEAGDFYECSFQRVLGLGATSIGTWKGRQRIQVASSVSLVKGSERVVF